MASSNCVDYLRAEGLRDNTVAYIWCAAAAMAFVFMPIHWILGVLEA